MAAPTRKDKESRPEHNAAPGIAAGSPVRWPLLVLANLLLVGVILLAAELVLRRSTTRIVRQGQSPLSGFLENDPDTLIEYTPKGRRLVPGSRVVIRNHYLSRRDILVEINSQGFRDRELPPHKGPDELRILVLGDSITWGDYLPADEVYVEQAEGRLRALLPGRKVEVINGGVGDIGLAEEIEILLERGLALRPDVVLVSYYLNDSRPPSGFAGEVARPGWLRRHSVLASVVYRNLRLRGWLSRQGEERFAWIPQARRLDWTHDPQDFRRLAEMARYDWGAAWREESWEAVAAGFARLRQLGREHGFRLAVAAFPVSFQVLSDVPDDSPQRRLREILERDSVPFLDLLPVLRAHRGEDLFFDQCHPKPGANTLVGLALAEFLDRVLAEPRGETAAEPQAP